MILPVPLANSSFAVPILLNRRLPASTIVCCKKEGKVTRIFVDSFDTIFKNNDEEFLRGCGVNPDFGDPRVRVLVMDEESFTTHPPKADCQLHFDFQSSPTYYDSDGWPEGL